MSSHQTNVSPSREKKPFTVPHARRWASALTLDSGDAWKTEGFQERLLADLFAGYPEVWLIIPEGNAKTTLAGGIALYHAEHTREAMVTVAASSRDQALWLYLAADGFVNRSGLKGFRCQEGYRRIRYDRQGSRIQVYAADDRTGDGAQPTLAILDELHRHRDMRLYRTWRGKLAKRKGQLLAISTAGEPEGEFEQVRAKMKEQATKVTTKGGFSRFEGDGYVLHEYALPDGKSSARMRDVKMCNPLSTITVEALREKYESPSMTEAHWLRFNCGRPAFLDTAAPPITPEAWDACAVEVGGLTEGERVQAVVRVGQQGGCSIGIAASRGDAVAVGLEHYPYSFPGLQAALGRLVKRYDVKAIHLDPRQHGMGIELLEQARFKAKFKQTPQSPVKFMETTATFLGLLSAGNIIHDGDEELRRQAIGARMRESITGAYLEPYAETQGLVAVVIAAHEVSGTRTPKVHVWKKEA